VTETGKLTNLNLKNSGKMMRVLKKSHMGAAFRNFGKNTTTGGG
jgi:hypothetical protein